MNKGNVLALNNYKKSNMNYQIFSPSELAKLLLDNYQFQDTFIKYIYEKKSLYIYKGEVGVWKKTVCDYIKRDIRQLLKGINYKWDKKSKINEVFDALKDFTADEKNMSLFELGVNADLNYINLTNGMYDLKNKELLEHNPEYYSICQLPVKYDPEAKCPKWNATLKEWVEDTETIKFLQEFVGYCLIPDTRQEKALILLGSGSNGKSTFLKVVSHLFGKDNLTNISISRLTEQTGRFEVANLRNKLVNIFNDIDPKKIKDTGVIKTIISGQSLRAEKKYETSYDSRYVSRLIFAANRLPEVFDPTKAWYRRYEVVKFPNSFTPNDEGFDLNLQYKLTNELSGILNWALEGLHRLLQNEIFTMSEAMKLEKLKYKATENPIKEFYDLKITDSPGNIIPKSDVYRSYQDFCEQIGIKPSTQNKLTSRLRDYDIDDIRKSIDGKKIRCYKDIKVKQRYKS